VLVEVMEEEEVVEEVEVAGHDETVVKGLGRTTERP